MSKKIALIIFITLLVVSAIVIPIILLTKKSHHNNSNTPTTYSYRWETSADTPCSVPCGGGYRYQNVSCHKINDKTGQDMGTVDDKYCPSPEPDNKVACNTQACDWTVGPWSSCSISCGTGGTETRSVTCPAGNCQGTKPPTTQPCPNLQLCDWTYGAWTPTSAPSPCGKWDQTRSAQCLRDEKVVPDNQCISTKVVSKSNDTGMTCKWESGGWYPFPIDNLSVESFKGKTFNLLNPTDQRNGINPITFVTHYSGSVSPYGPGTFLAFQSYFSNDTPNAFYLSSTARDGVYFPFPLNSLPSVCVYNIFGSPNPRQSMCIGFMQDTDKLVPFIYDKSGNLVKIGFYTENGYMGIYSLADTPPANTIDLYPIMT